MEYKKKGVSPLIASVLLIVFTVVVGSFILTWLMNYNNTNTDKAEKDTLYVLNCSNQNVNINSVTKDGGNITLFVENRGKESLRLKTVTLTDTNGNMCSHSVSTTIDGGGMEKVNFTDTDCSSVSDSHYTARVSTTCGGYDTYEYTG